MNCFDEKLVQLQANEPIALEQTDLAKAQPERLARMYKKLEQYELSAFNPHRGPTDPAACKKAMGEYGGFWGWWIE